MYLARVVGRVWATAKNATLTGQRLLVLQPLTPELTPTGKRLIATDWAGAGDGELVYYCRGKECAFPFLPVEVPTDSTIVGIVDSVRVDRNAMTEARPAAVPAAAPVAPAPRRGRRS